MCLQTFTDVFGTSFCSFLQHKHNKMLQSTGKSGLLKTADVWKHLNAAALQD
jgi:hypothetical protein